MTAATPDPQGGRIERDPATKEPTGTLRETAVILVARRAPPPFEADIKAAILRVIALANSFGITSVHDANVAELMLAPYLELDRENALNARVTLAAQVNLLMTDASEVPAEVERIERLRQNYRGARLRITAAKLGVDGVLEARTAALLEPYVGGEDARSDDDAARCVRGASSRSIALGSKRTFIHRRSCRAHRARRGRRGASGQRRRRAHAPDGAFTARAFRGHPALQPAARGREHSGSLGVPRRGNDRARRARDRARAVAAGSIRSAVSSAPARRWSAAATGRSRR